MFNSVQLEVHGEVCHLVLNRPETGNRLDYRMLDELSRALQAAASTDARVVLLRALGPDFCLGYDPDYLRRIRHEEPDTHLADTGQLAQLWFGLMRFPKPLVVAAQGGVANEGLGLALLADVLLLPANARLSLDAVEQAQLPATLLLILQRRLPEALLRRWVLGGGWPSAQNLHALGLVPQPVDPDVLEEEAKRLAEAMAQTTAARLAGPIKKLLADLPEMPLQQALQLSAKMAAHARLTPEYQAALDRQILR